ncbi:MAG TPA: polysaccharide deacetylase family protein [Thermoanaerobaculia bacterium]|nr:polysaccharide deacetylase family protein [Thermoanaerobaculia bacterium]
MSRLGASVLMFHHVEPAARELDPPPLHPGSYVDRGDFAAMLDALASRGYRTWPLAAAARRALAGRRLPRRTVVLTFDDGCRCFRDHAMPELAARGMTATLFVVSGELGGTNRWDRPNATLPDPPPEPRHTERREELLDDAALRQLARAGIEVGSHGRRHRDTTLCSEAELRDEVAGSRDELASALGEAVYTFCYPYGRVDGRAAQAARAAGYLAAAAIHGFPGADADDLHALPRLIVHPRESRFELLLKASGAYRNWSRLPRLGLLSALRRGGPAG